MTQHRRNPPYATGSIRVAVWLNRRYDGNEYLAIDLGPLGRYEATVNPAGAPGLPNRGIPFAQGKGIVVWKETRHGPHGDSVFLRIKHSRFRGDFRAFLPEQAANTLRRVPLPAQRTPAPPG